MFYVFYRTIVQLIVFLGLCGVYGCEPVLAEESSTERVIFLASIFNHLDEPDPPPPGPQIEQIMTNLPAEGSIPAYERLELTFELVSTAENPYVPYDEAPPPGISPSVGVTVDALFTPDNWHTVYTQPAFYYQHFIHEIETGGEWIYPTDAFSWKVRFAPHTTGEWQFKISARDADGTTETPPQPFTVLPSENPGFVRVSSSDSRYFEFENGDYFPALGFNMPYNILSWTNPIVDNENSFELMSNNGIQFVRFWLTHWAIFGTAWNPWIGEQNNYAGYVPMTGLVPFNEAPGEWSMKLTTPGDAFFDSCRFLDGALSRPAVKQQTTYQVDVRYWALNIDSNCPDSNCGFTVQIGTSHCGETARVTEQYGRDTNDEWQTLSGRWFSADNDYLPRLHLLLDNVAGGATQLYLFVSEVSIREDLTPNDPTDDRFGPNIIDKYSTDHHRYIAQRNAFAFDNVVELAERHRIYLRPVILEKGDRIFSAYDEDGVVAEENPDHFYGDYRNMTKTRWLYQTWWRYLQARWGYSTSIHSWELLNEGDPWNERHYALADEFADYMHQYAPNDHLVSTSMWHSYPREAFWANPDYSHVDFVDIHQYLLEGQESDHHGLYASDDYYDMALITQRMSMAFGAQTPGGAGKPLIRGEIGFHDADDRANEALLNDTEGIWLHNLIWGGINPGGLIESYWHIGIHIYSRDEHGDLLFDHRWHFRPYHNFIETIPLNNGRYQDIDATVSTEQLRAWGQKDTERGCAHLWIQNTHHTWKRVVDGESIDAISGSVTFNGLQPEGPYTLEWWDPYQVDPAQQPIRSESVVPDASGSITIPVEDLATDAAVKVVSSIGCR